MHDLFYLLVKQEKIRIDTCELFEVFVSEKLDAAIPSNNQQN